MCTGIHAYQLNYTEASTIVVCGHQSTSKCVSDLVRKHTPASGTCLIDLVITVRMCGTSEELQLQNNMLIRLASQDNRDIWHACPLTQCFHFPQNDLSYFCDQSADQVFCERFLLLANCQKVHCTIMFQW